jgi:hypothetical protein
LARAGSSSSAVKSAGWAFAFDCPNAPTSWHRRPPEGGGGQKREALGEECGKGMQYCRPMLKQQT